MKADRCMYVRHGAEKPPVTVHEGSTVTRHLHDAATFLRRSLRIRHCNAMGSLDLRARLKPRPFTARSRRAPLDHAGAYGRRDSQRRRP